MKAPKVTTILAVMVGVILGFTLAVIVHRAEYQQCLKLNPVTQEPAVGVRH